MCVCNVEKYRTCSAAHMISASKCVYGGKRASWRNIAMIHTDPDSIEDYGVSQCCVKFSPPHCRSRHTCLPYQVIRPLLQILTTAFHRIFASRTCAHIHTYSLDHTFQHPYRHHRILRLYRGSWPYAEIPVHQYLKFRAKNDDFTQKASSTKLKLHKSVVLSQYTISISREEDFERNI